ncbi:putative thioesterase [Actinacidiphila reveromycinica]|uniref:Putative thioesterase n=1 Tax=Actinacidiphila reveromycinica TaxID=659352 RepID=A0A7U3VT13_9ACTN|nr:alpha/beta fold hydrolase [Streptomyces sp. SN-593]BBB02260.1 putative thioesterase [Streptomyces sp. SN-593]
MSEPSADGRAWCRRFRPAPHAPVRLVCLPHAGGSASFYLPLAIALSPAVDVVAVQYPGRQDRRAEPPIPDMATLADRLHAVLRHEPERPLTVFGHSMGAVLGFELTRRLEADGRGPVRLFASGRRAPSAPRTDELHLTDDDILAELRRLDGTASALLENESLMRAALPALRADYRATEDYRCPPGTAVACPVTVFTGADDPKTTLDEAAAWAAHTSGAFDLQVFPGGHFFLTDQLDPIVERLRRHFQETGAGKAEPAAGKQAEAEAAD